MRAWPVLLLLTACSWFGPTLDGACHDDVRLATPRAAGCLTIDPGAGTLLLVRTADGWSIPGGYLEPGETSDAAAARETREEAGVEVIPGPEACAVPGTGFVAHVCVSPAPVAPRPGPEVSEARWMTAEAIRTVPAADWRFPDQVPAYLAALEAAGLADERMRGGQGAPPSPQGTP